MIKKIFLLSYVCLISINILFSQHKTFKWSEKIAESLMKEYPNPSQKSFGNRTYWSYTDGLILHSFLELYKKTKNEKYFVYVKNYVEKAKQSGSIFDIENYNIDNINCSNILFDLYAQTNDTSYLKLLYFTRKQFDNHPRTASGGFWHKKIYPHQMWLDGLYMGQPFYAHFTNLFENGKNNDDIVHQFELIYQHTYDAQTGLLYHAWDESKQIAWANKQTGVAPNFWLRSIGWYMMALVDVLDYLPNSHKGYAVLVKQFQDLSNALIKHRDTSKIWYQVPNYIGKKGNYLESSGTLMFIYAFAKGVKNNYLPPIFKKYAKESFDAIIEKHLVEENENFSLINICSSAGLGGNPYRDGSYLYYISEKIIANDPHGIGPLMLAAIELDN